MSFEMVDGLNKRGQELVDAYKLVKEATLPDIVLDATKKALLAEKSRAVSQAIRDDVSVEEFETIVRGYKAYMRGDSEFINDAIDYLEDNLKKETNTPFTIMKRSTSAVVQYRIGLKATDVSSIFGVDASRAVKMVDNGFVETFVDTYLRKKINDTLSKYEELISPNKVKCSDVYKVDGRKMYNIDVNISISPSNIKDDTCEKIARVLEALEKEAIVL